jgi:hypothetical protein
MSHRNVVRIYFMSDASMLEKAYFIYYCLVNDLVSFTGFAPKFVQAYVDGMLALIQAALSAPQDSQVVDIQAQKTDVVNTDMELCRKLITKLNFFLADACKENIYLINEFGREEYPEARNSQKGLIVYMQRVVAACNKHAAELIAAGFSQAQIDELKDAADALLAANNDQEFYKGERRTLTQQRIEKMNAAWEVVLEVCKAGKIIFDDNPAKYKQYVLYKSGSGSGADVFSGDIAPGATVEILSEDITPSTMLDLENTGLTTLQFCLEDDANPCSSGSVVNPGDEKSIIADNLGSGSILKVTNLSDTVEGSYQATIS